MDSTNVNLDGEKDVNATDYIDQDALGDVKTVSATNDAQKPKKPKVLNSRTIVGSNKLGRNELCPCGSGVKYKKCHLLKQREETQRQRDIAAQVDDLMMKKTENKEGSEESQKVDESII